MVYMNATINIGAAYSTGPRDGLFHGGEPSMLEAFSSARVPKVTSEEPLPLPRIALGTQCEEIWITSWP